jgi:hypothetical protein
MTNRSLETIARELKADRKHETRDAIKHAIKQGALLNEAKEQLDAHGGWLPWLEANWPGSIRTAENRMMAGAFVAKFATVANLRFTVGGLYALAYADRAGHSEAVAAALAEAQTAWVSGDRVRRIIVELQQRRFEEARNAAEPPDEASDGAEPSASKDYAPPADDGAGDDEEDIAGDDDPDDPPFLEPPPSLTPRREAEFRQFVDGVKAIFALRARPTADFLAVPMSDFDLETTIDVLQQLLRERRKAANANQDSIVGVLPVKVE